MIRRESLVVELVVRSTTRDSLVGIILISGDLLRAMGKFFKKKILKIRENA